MTYRNELLAAQVRIASLECDLREAERSNAALRESREHATLRPAKKRHTRRDTVARRRARFGLRYERPSTLFPMFDDWHETHAFFTTPSSDSVLEWFSTRVIGSIFNLFFFTPCMALMSIPILPVVLLSGVRIGSR